MKKIAILTQPLIANYGGILQNFALQKALLKLGHKPVTVNRVANPKGKLRDVLSKLKNATYNKFKGTERQIFSPSDLNFIRQNATNFIKNNIEVTKDINSAIALKKHFEKEKYETVIVGSDQTWRPRMSADIYNYFLDFLTENKEINKTAYASSFGTDKWEFSEEETIKCKDLIQQFSSVSVREKSGVNLCKEYLNKKAIHVLDPTLLLTKDDYVEVFKNEKLKSNKGIFTYVLDKDIKKQNIINEVKQFFQLETYRNQPKKEFFTDKSDNLEDFVYPKIESWIKSFDDADFVVTDSFHGTVFSIIFNKPFLVLVNKERGASRFYSLLNQLGLEERLIVNFDDFSEEILKQKIDYTKVNSQIEKLRKNSLDYLESSI